MMAGRNSEEQSIYESEALAAARREEERHPESALVEGWHHILGAQTVVTKVLRDKGSWYDDFQVKRRLTIH
jgi:hypothetical protein